MITSYSIFNKTLLITLFVSSVNTLLAADIKYSGTNYKYYVVNQDKVNNIKMFWRDKSGSAYKTLDNLVNSQPTGSKLIFATNGGIYGKNYKPLGLYIENGKRYFQLSKGKGGGNFYLQPNGVFYINKFGAKIVDTQKYKPAAKVLQAIQSGPLLVENNKIHPRFLVNSTSKYIRSGVGVTKSGSVIFAISEEPINFYQFATFFRDKLNTNNALYLDGSISSMFLNNKIYLYHLFARNFVSMIGVVK